MDELYYRRLLKKYRDGTATEAEREMVERWYAEANVVRHDDEPETDRQQRMERNWQALQTRIGTAKPVRRMPVVWYRVAAALVLLTGLGWALLRFTNRPETARPVATVAENPAILTLTNNTLQPQRHRLPDGSVVDLQPGSRLELASALTGAERVVRLAGVASFAVRRDTARPFLVYGNGVVTRVLGTRFTVRAIPGKPTAEVSVREGRVAVYRQAEKTQTPHAERLILTPNERATYSLTADRLTKTLVENPVVLTLPQTPPPGFVFDDTPLATVFAELERAYNVDIEYDAALLRNCTLTARLTDQPLFTKLRMICASVGADYTVQGTRLVVSGGGCD